MTGQDLITEIREELLEPIAGFWTDAELLRQLNRGESDFSQRVRGFEGAASASTLQGQTQYPLPANWFSSVGIFYNDKDISNNDHWYPLKPTDLQEMARENPDFLNASTSAQGKPKKFFIWQNSIYIFPAPDVTGDSNLKMFFKAKSTPLTSASSSLNVDDTLSGGIKAFVLWKAWEKEKEVEMADEQKQIYFDYVRQGLRMIKLRILNKINNVDIASNQPFGGF